MLIAAKKFPLELQNVNILVLLEENVMRIMGI